MPKVISSTDPIEVIANRHSSPIQRHPVEVMLFRLKAALLCMFFAFRPWAVHLSNILGHKYKGEMTWLNLDADRRSQPVNVVDLEEIREIHIKVSKGWARLSRTYIAQMELRQVELLFNNLASVASEVDLTVNLRRCHEEDFGRLHNRFSNGEAFFGPFWRRTRTMRDMKMK